VEVLTDFGVKDGDSKKSSESPLQVRERLTEDLALEEFSGWKIFFKFDYKVV